MENKEEKGFFQEHKVGTTILYYGCFIPWIFFFIMGINGAISGASVVDNVIVYGWPAASATMLFSLILLGPIMLLGWIYQLIYAVQTKKTHQLFLIYSLLLLITCFIFAHAEWISFIKNPITWPCFLNLLINLIRLIKLCTKHT